MKYVIPDIHGGYRALKQCLELVSFDYENDELFTLGDYFDGWEESILVIEELLKIKKRISLLGNHDSWVQDYLLGRLSTKASLYQTSEMDLWLYNRGESTKKEIDANPNKKEMLINFLKDCKFYHTDEQQNLYVHAGFDIRTPIESQPPRELIWGRKLSRYIIELYKQNKSLKNGYSVKRLKALDKYNQIYLGHTYCGETPICVANVNLLDSGCGYGDGKLTIMNVITKEYKQSDLLKDLYNESILREMWK